MSAHISLQARVDEYLAERRRLGFELKSMGFALASFARYVAAVRHRGALSVDLMAEWARHDQCHRGTAQIWARRLKLLRPFARYLRQFEPRTEVPDESVFGPVPGRVAPHIYREEEIVDLLAAARELRPHGGLRPATFETLFGLIASVGLRLSEALGLLDADVDVKFAMLTVRQTKFAKSRQLPLHPSTVGALGRYRRLRARHVRTTAETPYLRRHTRSAAGPAAGRPAGPSRLHRAA